MGVRIKFLIPNADAPWQKAEELAWKDQVAMKIDARNTYQYAPHGLVLVQVISLFVSCLYIIIHLISNL